MAGNPLLDAQFTRKVVVAHPEDFFAARVYARVNEIPRVALRDVCPQGKMYVLDRDELAKLPEEGFRVL